MTGRHRRTHARRPARSHPHTQGASALTWRQVRADPWVSLLLAVLVFVMTLLATVGPRMVTDLNSRQVAYTVRELSVVQRDVLGTAVSQPSSLSGSAGELGVFDPPEQTWALVYERLEGLRSEQPEPLRSLMQPGRFYVDVDGLRLTPDDPESDIARIDLQYRVDPLLPDLVRLVEGDWPTPFVPMDDVMVEGPDGPQTGPGGELEIVLSADAAEQLRWEVGEVRDVATAARTRLSGIYVPDDPQDPHWQHSTYGAELGVFFDADLGAQARAAAYLAPGNPGLVTPESSREVNLWYPLDATDVPGDDVGSLTAQLGALTAAELTLIDWDAEIAEGRQLPGVATPDLKVQLSTEIFDVLRDLSAQQRATASILAVVSAGPIGVALAVFALGARLIVTRRSSTLALASARGGSERQMRGVLATEGALLGLPATTLGYVVAGLLVAPLTPWSWPALVVAVLIGLVPAGVLALGPTLPSLRQGRSDLGSRSGPGRGVRWIVEVSLVAVAALAVWRLLDRGLTGVAVPEADGVDVPTAGGTATAGPAVDTGVDLLMAATPLLLALAAAVLTLRLYPIPLRVLTRLLHARSGLSAFVGSARALRDPAGGLVPALAMILGVAVATFSTVLASTIADGADGAAWAHTGAQIRISGPRVSDDLIATLREVPGITAVARVTEGSSTVEIVDGQTPGRVSVYIVDDALAQVHQGAPLVQAFPEALYAGGSPLPVLAGGDVSDRGAITLTGVGPARALGHVDELPGSRTDRQFLVVARSAWEAIGGTTAVGNVAVLSVAQETDREEVAEAVRQAVPDSLVQTPQARLEAFREAPVNSGLNGVFALAVLLTTGLTVLAILLVQAIGSPSRVRLLAVLRTLGLGRRQGRALTGWELAPVLSTAVVVGGLLGVTVPWLLLRAVDLRGLTGSTQQPSLSLDPLALGLLALGILVTVAVAVAGSAALAARTDLAQHLRLGEER